MIESILAVKGLTWAWVSIVAVVVLMSGLFIWLWRRVERLDKQNSIDNPGKQY